ncbi:hypothetical protein G7Y89_g990 [Cudoniella acicularis]|uniref:Uncharacterized protein n=1 Tax=Cudoniella acicularis TaxID=354080 RepID=A0A8H4RWZ1_9HELO|nr:hypothetical protein G7Y89_g990 [Cudoniella acicularis]
MAANQLLSAPRLNDYDDIHNNMPNYEQARQEHLQERGADHDAANMHLCQTAEPRTVETRTFEAAELVDRVKSAELSEER